MSDPVALALIATIPPTVAVILAAMRGEQIASQAAQTRTTQAAAINGGMEQAKKEIVDLRAEVVRLNTIIAEKVK